jgi:hypothetical protein
VSYGLSSPSEQTTILDIALLKNHRVEITGLQPNTQYQYILINRDAMGNTTQSGVFTFTTNRASQPINWTDLVGVSASGGTLTKTAAAGWNAGAASLQSIPANGAVEFTANSIAEQRMLGLSNINADASFSTIKRKGVKYNIVKKQKRGQV